MGCLKWSGSLLALVLLASLRDASVTAWKVDFGENDDGSCLPLRTEEACCVFTDDAGGALVRGGSCSEVFGPLDLSRKDINSVPPNAFEGMTSVE